MKNKKIVIAGGTGFIGQEMIRYFGSENEITILTRQKPDAANNRNRYSTLSNAQLGNVKFIKWDGKNIGDWIVDLENSDLLINLAGKTVNCRYTEHNKHEIMESRINSVNAIGAAINLCRNPPKLWINASSATIYRHATDKPQDEYSTEFKDGFSVSVCRAWENSVTDQVTPRTRKVILRMAITLGAGGVMITYFNLLKLGLGGRLGSGRQMFSWIHIEDSFRMIEWIANHNELAGIYNCSAPNPVPNKTFMEKLRSATGYSFGLPASEWMLKVGAKIIGTETELVMKSRWVVPTKILETGFVFKYPLLEDALKELISKVPRTQYRVV